MSQNIENGGTICEDIVNQIKNKLNDVGHLLDNWKRQQQEESLKRQKILEEEEEKRKQKELDLENERARESRREQDQEHGEIPYRVVHFKMNPFQYKLRKQREQVTKLSEENERLRARLEILESGNDADVTRKIEDAVANAHENETLRRRLHEAEQREAKIMTAFRKTSREFREVCYLLTGYRIDGLKDGKFRLSNMYASSPDDVLYFEMGQNGTIQLLQNEYSERLNDNIEAYLEKFDSFPAFLASLTLELFKSSTQMSLTCINDTVRTNK